MEEKYKSLTNKWCLTDIQVTLMFSCTSDWCSPKFSELLLQKGHGTLPSCLTSWKQEGWKVRNTALTEAYISPEQFIPKTHKLFHYFGETLGGLRYTHFHFFCLHIWNLSVFQAGNSNFSPFTWFQSVLARCLPHPAWWEIYDKYRSLPFQSVSRPRSCCPFGCQ